MLGTYWYHGLSRKYVSIFGTLFNDIYIHRKNSSGNVVENIKVPLAYGPKQKFLTRITGDPNLDRKVGMQLPRMGFEMTSMSYSPERMLHPLHQGTSGCLQGGGQHRRICPSLTTMKESRAPNARCCTSYRQYSPC